MAETSIAVQSQISCKDNDLSGVVAPILCNMQRRRSSSGISGTDEPDHIVLPNHFLVDFDSLHSDGFPTISFLHFL